MTHSIYVDEMSLGLKHRPHLCAAIMANASLSRLPRLNRQRARNYKILTEELAECSALETIGAYPAGERRLPRVYFALSAGARRQLAAGSVRPRRRAEGVGVAIDRYTSVLPSSNLLHQCNLFNAVDRSRFGGALSSVYFDRPPRDVNLPNAEQLAHELVSMPPFTAVSEKFIRRQARGMCKVVEAAKRIRDFRTGL